MIRQAANVALRARNRVVQEAARARGHQCAFSRSNGDYRAPIPSYTAESEPVLSGANPSHDLSAWAKVTDRIHVWDYMSNFNNFL